MIRESRDKTIRKMMMIGLIIIITEMMMIRLMPLSFVVEKHHHHQHMSCGLVTLGQTSMSREERIGLLPLRNLNHQEKSHSQTRMRYWP
jgi:hypothetical protein